MVRIAEDLGDHAIARVHCDAARIVAVACTGCFDDDILWHDESSMKTLKISSRNPAESMIRSRVYLRTP